MKIKSLNNQGEIIGSTIISTLILLMFFGGLAFSFNSLLWLIPFLIGFKIVLFLMLRNLKGLIFYTDKLEVAKYGLSDQKQSFPLDQVALSAIEAVKIKSAKIPVTVFLNEKKLGIYLIKDQLEFEEFRQKTTAAGFRWESRRT